MISILTINNKLKNNGIKCLLFDLDNTIVPFNEKVPPKKVIDLFKKVKDLGFKIAVDGFGIDQSTLTKLSDSPIDIIKLDRSFLEDDESYIQNKYIELLVEYAKNTNKIIICEGLED